MSDRINHRAFTERLMSAEQAAAFIKPGMTVAMSGFTGAGYPKAVPGELAKLIAAEHDAGRKFKINVLTGASTAPELDGVLAKAEGMNLRLPYMSDPELRRRINDGEMEYMDIHLSHVAQHAWFGFYGKIDLAIVEVAGITADGELIPSTSVGNNKTWLEMADHVILEVNKQQSAALEGMHDLYYGTALPPHRTPIQLTTPRDRIGQKYLDIDARKVVAVVETDAPDRLSPFAPVDETSERIADHLLGFLDYEIRQGRLNEKLLPLQSGVGNIANAVLEGLSRGGYKGLTAYTEVIQDGMLELIKDGTIDFASATSFSLSTDGVQEFNTNIDRYRDRILLRPQEISNHPEIIRRLGCIALNGMIEADIYGNVNSTNVLGSKVMNGIGGSGDFARNGYLSVFMSPSTAKGGKISGIVPFASHVDHTEHDTMILITEQGLADLRGHSPKQRAELIINNCAHPDYKALLQDYFDRACRESYGKHTPHLLGEALSWHQRFEQTGDMRPAG
ncbi:acetyl-CoA hydrolase/transferase family protein [Glutamicibacter sp.]|uniref:acetyl-CoA hydrolase/transferase family protein n=1 Tax=Glutamicibacter sp. TaxID=1931995 RepID=UPI0037C0D052